MVDGDIVTIREHIYFQPGSIVYKQQKNDVSYIASCIIRILAIHIYMFTGKL